MSRTLQFANAWTVREFWTLRVVMDLQGMGCGVAYEGGEWGLGSVELQAWDVAEMDLEFFEGWEFGVVVISEIFLLTSSWPDAENTARIDGQGRCSLGSSLIA
jgi:hypothetical protein